MKGQLFLLKELVRRDLQSRYVGSMFGFLWSFAQPLWQLLLFTLVFSVFLKFPLPEEEITTDFGIFLFSGLLPWMAIQEGVTRASTAIVDNAAVVKKAKLPLRILVMTPMVSALIHEAIAAAVFVVILAAQGLLGWRGLPILLLALPLQLAMTVGLGFLLCSAHTFFRDIAQVVNMVMMGWFYVTPIVFSLLFVGEKIANILLWNPLTPLVDLYRHALLGDGWVWVEGTPWLIVFSCGVFVVGWWLFGRLEGIFVDQV